VLGRSVTISNGRNVSETIPALHSDAAVGSSNRLHRTAPRIVQSANCQRVSVSAGLVRRTITSPTRRRLLDAA